jgi:hypothetical protein
MAETVVLVGGNAYRLGSDGSLEGAAVLDSGAIDSSWYMIELRSDAEYGIDYSRVLAIAALLGAHHG